MASRIITPRSPVISTVVNSRRSPVTVTKPQDVAFMELARKRFKLAAESTNRIRQDALEDLQFYSGKQWPAVIESDRVLQNRPCLTINRLQQFAKQILNAQRASRPSIQVNPVGDGADVETAEIIEGLVRHIELISGADSAYDKAFEGAVIHGFGYFRILTAPVDDEDPFHLELRIARIEDPFSVYFDPFCKEQDYSDAQFCFIVEDLPTDVYREMYPDSEVASLSDFRSIGDGEREWFTGGNIRTAEYFYVTKKKKTMVQLVDGTLIDQDDLDEQGDEDSGAERPIMVHDGKPMVRDVEVPVVHWCKINAVEKIEVRDWAGKYIPVIPALGDELVVDGRKQLYGIVRQAKDAQRQYNYMRTGVVEQIALMTRAPWLVAEGQIENHEQQWRLQAVRNYPFLTYKAMDVNGHLVPPPIRNQFEPPIQALSAGLMQSNADLQSTTGEYNPALGQADTPDQSGIAISNLQRQGEQANSHFLDNLSRSIRHAGRIILDLIPKIYDSARIIRIVDPDQTHRLVAINGSEYPAPPAPQPTTMPLQQAVKKVYDLTVGKYDVAISVGTSYQTKRAEFVASVMSLVKAAPQVFSVVMDLVVRHMDWPGAQEIADRLHKMLPPNLQDAPEQPEVPPQIQAQIQSLLQEKAALVQMLQKAQNPLEVARINNESKERIALLGAKVDIILGELSAHTAKAVNLADNEYQAAGSQLETWNETRRLDHEARLAAMQSANAAMKAQGASGGPPPGGPGAPAPGAPPAPPPATPGAVPNPMLPATGTP